MEQSEQKHSGIGIASFIVSIVAGILIFILIVIAGIMESSTHGGVNKESAQMITLGLLIIAMLFVDLIALGLGIGGLCQKGRKKIFALLGTLFSAVAIVGTIFLIIIGNTM